MKMVLGSLEVGFLDLGEWIAPDWSMLTNPEDFLGATVRTSRLTFGAKRGPWSRYGLVSHRRLVQVIYRFKLYTFL